MVKRAEDAGCPALVMTVDGFGGRNAETSERLAKTDIQNCLDCHVTSNNGRLLPPPGSWPMTAGIEDYGRNTERPTWQHVDRLKKLTKMKLVLKGIETREDARLCKEHGVDGIVVSNHGGRATEDLAAHHRKPSGGDRWRGRPDEDHGGRRFSPGHGCL